MAPLKLVEDSGCCLLLTTTEVGGIRTGPATVYSGVCLRTCGAAVTEIGRSAVPAKGRGATRAAYRDGIATCPSDAASPRPTALPLGAPITTRTSACPLGSTHTLTATGTLGSTHTLTATPALGPT
jgi:hypothetical protein